jgi:capsular polysaccharide biosynthesis protein
MSPLDSTRPFEADDMADGAPSPRPALVSLHFLRGAVRRRRRRILIAVLIAVAAAGSFRIVSPGPTSAVTTLLLQHPDGVDPAQAMATDANMLQTRAVAQRTINRVGEHITPDALLSSTKVEVLTNQVLRVTVQAPSPQEAVRRADALAAVFLDFRADQFERQTSVVDDARQAQIKALRADITALTSQINSSAGDVTKAATTTDLVAQRAQASDQVSELQRESQDAQLQDASVVTGSHALDAAAPKPAGTTKRAVLNAITAGIAMSILAVMLVLVSATISDRVRRRNDVACLVGADVLVSLRRFRFGRWRASRALQGRDLRSTTDLDLLTGALDRTLDDLSSAKPVLAVVPVDRPRDAAVGLALFAASLRDEGKQVVLLDLSHESTLARMAGLRGAGGRELPGGPAGGSVTAVRLATSPAPAFAPRTLDNVSPEYAVLADAWKAADVVLVFATLDPAHGASHLRSWAGDAVVAVTAGASTAERIGTTAEMVRASGMTLRYTFLFRSDPTDESLGHDPVAAPAPEVRRDVARLDAS